MSDMKKTPNISAILLGGGCSRRMGCNKLLKNWQGKKMIHYPLHAINESSIPRAILVLGFEAEKIRAELDAVDSHKITPIIAADWQKGMGHSLRAGLEATSPNIDGVIVMLADMPKITYRAS